MAMTGGLVKKESQDRADLVAYWSVPLCDGVHTVEFEHGTVSGKRVLRIDGKVTYIHISTRDLTDICITIIECQLLCSCVNYVYVFRKLFVVNGCSN